jgi:hypothetical protein
MTGAMLIGAGISTSVLAALGGFEALSHAFLPSSSLVFVLIFVVASFAAPTFVWAPHWDIIRTFPRVKWRNPPRNEKEATKLVFLLWGLGVLLVAVGVIFRASGALRPLRSWQSVSLTVAGLLFTVFVVIAGSFKQTRTGERGRLGPRETWTLAAAHSILVLGMVAILP